MRDQAIQESGNAGQGRSRPAGIRGMVDRVHGAPGIFDRIFRPVLGYERTRLGNGGSWARSVQLGRLQLSYRIYRHVYPSSADRWVIQPEIIWDRKR